MFSPSAVPRLLGSISRSGHLLNSPDFSSVLWFLGSGRPYIESEPGVLRCVELGKKTSLLAGLSVGAKSRTQLKEENAHECSAA